MRPDLNRLARRLTASVGVLSMAVVGLVASPAAADTAPADTTLPQTVSSDSLPTAQIDGIAWDQKIAGNTVYVGGRFTSVRPAGAAPGVSTVARSNMMAYDIRTGQHTSFAPTFNGQVRAVAVSPDGSRVYAAGEFTSVNGTTMYRVAAFSTATGALITSFRPNINARLASIAVTDTTVYVGGIFSTVNGQPRNRVAAISAANGAVLPSLGSADNGAVNALVLSPDGSKLVVGGSFTTFNASAKPGYGLALVDTATAQMLPLPANDLIRNGGANASITSLSADADNFYGSGYVFGSGGNLEGTFAARWADGTIAWVEDCHGDTYQSVPVGDVVYSASHKHSCSNMGGFPETTPRSFYRATAVTRDARRTLTREPSSSYFNYVGNPAPELLNWFPSLDTGSFSGSNQGPWAVAGNSQYVVMSGEFNRVNNVGQQGLARFAVPAIAPNRDGPRLAGAAFNPRVRSVTPGEVRISWPANWDRDNATLTYKVYRTSSLLPPIFEQEVTAPFWKGEDGTFVDTGLEPGSTQRYRVTATDPRGNVAASELVPVTVATAQTADPYAGEVLGDGASSYWRLGESSGTTVTDWAGLKDAVAQTGVIRGAKGAVPGDAASTFDGTTAAWASTQKAAPAPNTVTVEAWVNTTSTTGGKIAGYGNNAVAPSSSYDRQLYMDNAGRIFFGVYSGAYRVLNTTTSFNDGQWHHVAASLGSNGMRLYVDGKLVGQRTDTTAGQNYNGYWRIGGDTIGVSWPSSPTSKYLAGAIDDVAVYPSVLLGEQVLDHYLASGRTSTLPAKPADAYGAAVRDSGADLYWRLGESEGTQAADTGLLGSTGTYRSGVTLGATGPTASGGTTAVTLDGVDDYVSADTPVTNPRVYSQELWFSTTTTAGGRLIGLGTGKDVPSTTYDRQVYMGTDGRLTFGTWTGTKNLITSPAAYNDGAWHHLVATQSSEGMRLYVDGALVAQNAVTGAQSYTGYWRVGADRSWGPSQGFAGTVDEAAIYYRALSPQTVADHYALGSGGPVNGLPTAAFTPTVTGRGLSVDAAASKDPEGGALTYAWDFGDGTTGTGATATHTYAADGTFTVRLTVTDAAGGTGTTQQPVTVQAPVNQVPTAAFTTAVRDLAVDLDASASADADGTLASWAWDFGDGRTGSGRTTSHTYAAAGTYTVRLTVTDAAGATGTTTRDVTVTAAPVPNVAPTAAFTSTTRDLTVSVDGSGSSDPDGTVASYAWEFGDGTTGTGATATRTYAAAGTYTVRLTVTDAAGATGTTTRDVTVTAAPVANVAPTAAFTSTTQGLTVSVDGSGSSDRDGTVASHAWDFGDGSTGTGARATRTYAAAGTYTVRLTVTDNAGATGTQTGTVTVTAPPAPPTAPALAQDAFTRAVTGGWGPADVGGTWTTTGPTAQYSVDGSAGRTRMAAGATVTAALAGVSSTDTEVQVTLAFDKLANGGGVQAWVVGRQVGTSDYRGRLKVNADGTVDLSTMRGGTALSTARVAGLTYAAGDQLQVRVQVTGTAPTTIRAKVWKVGQAEPADWQRTSTDSTAALQTAGGIGVGAYLSSSVTNGPVVAGWDGLWAGPTAAAPVAGA